MTPLYLRLLLPAVQVVGAGLISSRISWRNHPALIAWLFSEVFFQGVALSGSPLPQWFAVPKAAILAAVVFEVLSYARFRVPAEIRGVLAGLMLAGSAALASLPAGLSAIQHAYLFRSFCLLSLAAALAGAVVLRMVRPVLVSRRHRAYLLGATAWMCCLAVAGSFVPGGLGYALLPHTRQTWQAVNLATYWALIVTIAGMSLAIWSSAPGRKRAAKRPDGRTATGLIEMDRRAA